MMYFIVYIYGEIIRTQTYTHTIYVCLVKIPRNNDLSVTMNTSSIRFSFLSTISH